jgi:TetR/AcrR family transcriptional repressor of nem operon
MPRTKSFDQTEILEKVTGLFWQQGYNSTPPQAILDETGLSRSSLYDTYGDKHTLFLQCLSHYRNGVTASVIRYLDESSDGGAAIRKIFHAAWEHSRRDRPRKGCLMVNTLNEVAPHDPEVADIVQENRQALEDAFFRAVRRGQQLGSITRSQSPRALARYIQNSLWGLTVNLKLGIDKKVADDIVKITLSALQP